MRYLWEIGYRHPKSGRWVVVEHMRATDEELRRYLDIKTTFFLRLRCKSWGADNLGK